MSENIMSGIMKAVNKNLERDIAKKLNSLCSKYYNSNKKLQEMISKEASLGSIFPEVIDE